MDEGGGGPVEVVTSLWSGQLQSTTMNLIASGSLPMTLTVEWNHWHHDNSHGPPPRRLALRVSPNNHLLVGGQFDLFSMELNYKRHNHHHRHSGDDGHNCPTRAPKN